MKPTKTEKKGLLGKFAMIFVALYICIRLVWQTNKENKYKL